MALTPLLEDDACPFDALAPADPDRSAESSTAVDEALGDPASSQTQRAAHSRSLPVISLASVVRRNVHTRSRLCIDRRVPATANYGLLASDPLPHKHSHRSDRQCNQWRKIVFRQDEPSWSWPGRPRRSPAREACRRCAGGERTGPSFSPRSGLCKRHPHGAQPARRSTGAVRATAKERHQGRNQSWSAAQLPSGRQGGDQAPPDAFRAPRWCLGKLCVFLPPAAPSSTRELRGHRI